ncbi:PilC/PilY family type IV pilus protein [Ottowia sp.]|uniref:pilus assembly protein n=1 Tax=Ottowia sp. TaxID=1898956 RepID=UPI00260C2029|nr:PilC/PilY family type IV pilus protein [Ottowia sp.]
MKTWSAHKVLASLAAILLAGLSGYGVVISAASPPNIKSVNIASTPLYAATQGDKPTLALALSVEFPTVGAQYVDQPGGTTDATYSSTKEYLGYYNSEMCYTYVDAPTETPASGKTAADYKRFKISGAATSRKCSDAFSGNFLNWATSSAVDMLRLALSGGDRYIDQEGLTILQRAVLPNGDPTCMWNSSNFPGKQLNKGTDGSYDGAVPTALITAANNAGITSIWVANTLNRIYFGASKTGSCSNTGGYTLGSPSSGIGPITTGLGRNALPASATDCAGENGTCTVPAGTVQAVWYGASSRGGGWNWAPATGDVSCSNATFGDPASGISKSCYLVPYTGTWAPTAGMNSDGFFYSRVQVCDLDNSGNPVESRDYYTDRPYCTKYPNGKLKPTGTIQKYSDQLRLAAFGYAMDPTKSGVNNGRYGGVLRAPMKYVGPRSYDENGVENTPASGNAVAEWNPNTGIFLDNPDSDTSFGISGVINYLNRFGRTGPTAGRYKTYDPASELYYESLRYLQGLQPSAGAVSNLTTSMYDGYPIYTDWTNVDPYGGNRSRTADYSCVKSNIALIGDVNTWDSKYNGNNLMPGPDAANNIPDIEGWIKVVQAFEKGTSLAYIDGQGVTRNTSNPNAANPNPNTRGPQTYGLAYWAHTHDIRGTSWANGTAKQRPGLRVKSFFFDVNEYANQSVDATRRTNNQYYTAGKYGGFRSQPTGDASKPYNTQGNPFYDVNGVATNDVWQDPARPLEPQTYFLQSNARGVLAAFESIFSQASSAQRSIAGAATGSGNITQSGSLIYQASFDTSQWTGDLQAFSLSANASNTSTIDVGSTATWSAEQQLSQMLLNGTARNIVVGKTGANPNPTATDFTTGAIETSLQTDLNRFNSTSAVDNLWQDRVDYLRGSKAKEGNPFRRRYKAMGDVVNSGVAYVGAPATTRALGDGYAAFATAQASRTAAVYVGANDGMMHAFNAATGNELFGYIPSWLGPKLAALTDPNYGSSVAHQAYADATPVIGDAKVGAGTAASDWKTVLVSGSGGGGRGVFALDVTDPTAFGTSKVMWEFTQANDPDMGFVLGKPRIVKMRTSDPSATTATYRWFAMVPAGVNNYVPDNNGVFSTTGAPTIFLLALDKPAGTAWTSTGSSPNYYKISLPFDATLAVTKATGIINLEAFTDAASVVDYVFAGDLHGKLWALDFTGFGATDWTSGKLSKFSTGSGTGLVAYPMYVAKDASGTNQPITAAPTILQGPYDKTHYVSFGTGKYIEPLDPGTSQTNTFYVLYDNGSGSAAGGTSGVAGINGRGRLQAVTKDASGNLAPSASFVWGRATSDGDTTQRSGWYYDLPATGERVIYDSVYVTYTSKVAFSSLTPDAASTPGVCTVSGGSGTSYYVDLVTATGLTRTSYVGVMGTPMIGFNDEQTTTTTADSTGRRLRTRPTVLIQQGSTGISAQQAASETFPVGRLSWRQINNYLELKNK